jgi:hypothetical protein
MNRPQQSPSEARAWSLEEDEDLVESTRAGIAEEDIAKRYQASRQDVRNRLIQLGWLTPDRNADPTIDDVLVERDFGLPGHADPTDPRDNEEEDRSCWHLWRELSLMIEAQRAGGSGYYSIVSVLENPEPWLSTVTLQDPTFPDELLDVADSIEQSFLITSKPAQVIQRVWDLRRAGAGLGSFSLDTFASVSEPYYAIFFGCDDSPVLGRLSDSTQLAALRRRFRLDWFDVEVAAEILGSSDGDIKSRQALDQFVVPESEIEAFIRRYAGVLQQAGEDGQADLLLHVRRLSAERSAVIDDLRGLNDWDDEPEPEPPAFDYEPDDSDDYEQVQDAIDPEMPKDDEVQIRVEDDDY